MPVTLCTQMGACTAHREQFLASPSTCHPLKDMEVHKRLVIAGQTVILNCPWDVPRDHDWLGTEWPSFPSTHVFGCPRWWSDGSSVRLEALGSATAPLPSPDIQDSSAQWYYLRERLYCYLLPSGKRTPEHYILGFSTRILECLHGGDDIQVYLS